MVGSIVVAGALRSSAFLHSVCDLKAAQMIVLQKHLLRERLRCSWLQYPKKMVQGVSHWLQERRRLGSPKSVDSEAVLQAIKK